MRSRERSFRSAPALTTCVVLASLSLSCIGGDATGPAEIVMAEAVALQGDGQFAPPDTELPIALEVLIRRTDGKELEEPVEVTWELMEGTGASLSRISGFTDEAQRARTVLILGPELGIYRVRATVTGVEADPVEFSARAVDPPTLASVAPDPVEPGAVVEVTGTGFVPEVELIDVLFAGIRARVLSGTATTLQVEVPPCLNESRVDVEVGLGALRSGGVSVGVEGRGQATVLQRSGTAVIRNPAAHSCVLLPGDPDARYLAVVHSAAPQGFLSHEFSLMLRHGEGEGLVAAPEATSHGGDARTPSSPVAGLDGGARHRWERLLREREARIVEEGIPRAPTPAPPAAAGVEDVPEVGDLRDFNVLNGDGDFDEVTAEARYVSDRAVIYVDLEAPDGGFEDGDLVDLGEEFDDPIFSAVGDVYGSVSDLDENDRVVILFTPTVNRLTEAGSDGFVGGFFFGVDLLPDRPGSNGGEIFYALVPDPHGTLGEARSRSEVLFTVPAVLSHELQHMIHFNERILIRDGERSEAAWLSEALAHSAEELVARAYRARGLHGAAIRFENGNHVRARSFLDNPSAVSLVDDGDLSLVARGASWLFLNHVRGEHGGATPADILRDLTRTTRTGIDNVETVVGRSWKELLEPWTGALYLDGLGLSVPSRYTFRLLRLRGEVVPPSQEYPLVPPVWGDGDRRLLAQVPSSAGYHVILEPTGSRGLAVNLAAPDGGAISPSAELGLTLVRLK